MWPTSTPFMEYILLEHHASAFRWKNIELTAKHNIKDQMLQQKEFAVHPMN